MYKQLVCALLLALASQQVYGQEAINPEDANAEQKTQIDSPEEPEECVNEPITEEPKTETLTDEDSIRCPNELCTCTHGQDGDSVKVKVDCSSKDLTALPIGIDRRVTHLLLNNNKLEELPKDIAEFKQLEELNVNDNSITDFAFGSMSELTKLRVLKAANNRLTEFPRELENEPDFASLREVDFGNNDIREELSLDLFTHMTNLSVLTLPAPSQDLVVALCHRLGPTLQKVCNNNCSIDEEDCNNYHVGADDLVSISQDAEQKQNENEMYEVTEQNIEQTDELITVTNDSKEKLKRDDVPERKIEEPSDTARNTIAANSAIDKEENNQVNIEEPSDTNSKGEELREDPEVPESNEQKINENVNDISPTEIVSEANLPTTGDSEPETDFSLRSAVSAAAGADDIAEVPPASEDEISRASEGDAPAMKSMSETTEKTPTVSVNAANSDIDKNENNQTDENIKVGAASAKKGGGIDNSVIALIVAGMIVVVAGVTIKKNWSAIRGKCNSRPTRATAATHGNGTTPEEVPLKDKANIV